ncbi:MAG TPA: hypothetical protein VJ044_02110 [Candidatus Hodarchaeales archaeon]|nr:hypothetical protein [Candidatus Hodarchaeales archaeon]
MMCYFVLMAFLQSLPYPFDKPRASQLEILEAFNQLLFDFRFFNPSLVGTGPVSVAVSVDMSLLHFPGDQSSALSAADQALKQEHMLPVFRGRLADEKLLNPVKQFVAHQWLVRSGIQFSVPEDLSFIERVG